MRRVNRVAGAVVAGLLSVVGCGVSSEDEPQLIEDSTDQRPPGTPSFDAETSPTRTPTTLPPAPATTTPSVLPTPPG